uniref:DUF3164 family protein n=1 Tax=uncultured Fibrobacter sp. TaxID=261512 RepID=UPI00261C4508|nr:DUF3164 family protein [uncultured Fibrobacter sp.]
MAQKDNQGNWLDPKGRPVPEEYIRPEDKKKDKLVESILKRVVKLSAKLETEKAEIVDSIEKYLKDLAKDNRVREGWKGNILLYNFSQNLCIERRIDESISFDERLQMVKTTIDKWIGQKLKDTDPTLSKVIAQAFSVDKQGRINTAMLLKLKRIDIQDAEWKKAMQLLDDSIFVKSSKMALRFRMKGTKNPDNGWTEISLNFNDIQVQPKKDTNDGN